jgi:phosphatidylinositol-3-phosphatase
VKVAAAAAALVALATAAVAAAAVPRVDHVVVIVFENKERGAVLGSGAAPTFDRLAGEYVDLTNYHALTHPSLPNYLALVSGSTQGIVDDCTDCVARGTTIGDELTRAGRTWAAYAEGYPRSARFAQKHMPFLYFPRDRAHVQPLTALRLARLPAFALIAPDLCHDMHDCAVATGDAWLRRIVQPLLRAPRTVVFVLFDEGTTTAGGGGHVAAIAAGTAVARRVRYTRPAGHYAVLRTIEDALGVPRLGASARATPLQGIWR